MLMHMHACMHHTKPMKIEQNEFLSLKNSLPINNKCGGGVKFAIVSSFKPSIRTTTKNTTAMTHRVKALLATNGNGCIKKCVEMCSSHYTSSILTDPYIISRCMITI
jgi:hypothetical protein